MGGAPDANSAHGLPKLLWGKAVELRLSALMGLHRCRSGTPAVDVVSPKLPAGHDEVHGQQDVPRSRNLVPFGETVCRSSNGVET
jgi:hypothetical protein